MRDPVSGFPVNRAVSLSSTDWGRMWGWHQEGGVLSNSSGQGTGTSTDHRLQAQPRVETGLAVLPPRGMASILLPFRGMRGGPGLPLHWGGGYSVGPR